MWWMMVQIDIDKWKLCGNKLAYPDVIITNCTNLRQAIKE